MQFTTPLDMLETWLRFEHEFNKREWIELWCDFRHEETLDAALARLAPPLATTLSARILCSNGTILKIQPSNYLVDLSHERCDLISMAPKIEHVLEWIDVIKLTAYYRIPTDPP